MVAMFTGSWLLAWCGGCFSDGSYGTWWGLILLYLPTAIDGATHLISDLSGLDRVPRQQRLVSGIDLNMMPASFISGCLGVFQFVDAFDYGILFGLGTIWYLFPLMDGAFQNGSVIEYKRRSVALLRTKKNGSQSNK
jgi:hypothetical protein